MSDGPRRTAVTGATGYVGARLVQALELAAGVEHVLAIDVRPPAGDHGPKTTFLEQDVSLPFRRALAEHEIDTVVHLA
ncbi:MAG: NAD-dependent epimerase/dehydratase family protein, partial [Candidatus Brocadiia bacterium]|nr:NAD-dependent epimerase/dehydratase family protein [Candidatus Brocadiia bacterium]